MRAGVIPVAYPLYVGDFYMIYAGNILLILYIKS